MFKIKNKKGFTLIEVMIVIAIIGIMSTLSIVSINAGKRQAELESAAEEVSAVLREAQNYSLTGKNTTSGCTRYSVTFTAGSSDYVLDNGGGACTMSQSYLLKNGVTALANSVIRFDAPHATKGGNLRVVLRKGSDSHTICANTAGLITKIAGNIVCP